MEPINCIFNWKIGAFNWNLRCAEEIENRNRNVRLRLPYTKDGRFHLPDNAVVITLQRSRIDTYATFFDYWDIYIQMHSSSINVDASVFSLINGKFSSEYKYVKQYQYNCQAKTTRVQIWNNLYKIILQPDSLLDCKFKNRLHDIAANLQNNNTHYATFLSDIIVWNYGTHVVRSVQADAIAAQVDAISSGYVNDYEFDVTSITASASANFFSKFSIRVLKSFSNSHTDDTKYVKNRNHSQVMTIGGPPFRPNMTLEKWQENNFDNLVAIDLTGEPLHFTSTPASVPKLQSPTYKESLTIFTHLSNITIISTHTIVVLILLPQILTMRQI